MWKDDRPQSQEYTWTGATQQLPIHRTEEMLDFRFQYGSYALVTGASAGLGEAIAEELAAHGLDLVLVARRKDKLEVLAERLMREHQITAKVMALDLTREGSVNQLLRDTEEIDIGLVVINAGQIALGAFLENDIGRETETLRLNSLIPLQLAFHFGNKLKARGYGGLLFVSSMIGLTAGPYQANSAASNAYVTSLGEALHAELKATDVHVTVLAPGGLNTEGVRNSSFDFSLVPLMDPQRVARIGIAALGRKALVVPGTMNAITSFLIKYVLPRSWSVNLSGLLVSRMIGVGQVKERETI